MIMDRGDFESIFYGRCHYRRDLTFKQNQITHHHCAAVDRFESRPSTERQCRLYRHPVQRYVQISARKAVSMNVTGYSRRTSKRVVDFFPINFLSCGPAAHDKRGRQNNNTSHSQCSFFLVPSAIDRQASPPALKQTETMRDCCSSFAHAQSPRKKRVLRSAWTVWPSDGESAFSPYWQD
jgi:hypothetical protein